MPDIDVHPAPRGAANPTVSVRDLTKRFRRRIVVDQLSFDVPQGTVTGFVGPNGAGKSTSLRMLVGLVRPSSGTGQVFDASIDTPKRYLDRVGALIEGPAFYKPLSARRNLEVLTTLGHLDVDRVDDVLSLVELTDRADDPVRTYSLGMKQRLAIAAALLPQPALLVLDEPTNGLDPAGIRDMRTLITRIAHGGVTVLVSSHLLSELQNVCDWIVVIDRGRLLYEGATTDLLAQGHDEIVVATADPADLDRVEAIARHAGHDTRRDGDHLRITAPAEYATELSRACLDAHIALTEVTPQRASLEDRFFELTGDAPRGEHA